MKKVILFSCVALCALFVLMAYKSDPPALFTNWSTVNGNSTGNKYSSLTQIDTSNVQQLQVAWEYHTGDADTAAHSQIQCNPIIVNGVLYGTSPQLRLFAIDA